MPPHKVVRNMKDSRVAIDPCEELIGANNSSMKLLSSREYNSKLKAGEESEQDLSTSKNDTLNSAAIVKIDNKALDTFNQCSGTLSSDSGDEFAEDDAWSNADSFADDDSDFASEDKEEDCFKVITKNHISSLPQMVPLISTVNNNDLPPSRPIRCFDDQYAELRLINEKSKARRRGGRRDELAQSEHVGGALRNSSDHSPCKPMRTPSNDAPFFGQLFLTEMKTKDDCFSMQSPSSSNKLAVNRNKRDRLSVSEHTGRQCHNYSHRRTAAGSELGMVTLRGPHDRVLKGSKELSTSEHLRRQAPSRRALPSRLRSSSTGSK